MKHLQIFNSHSEFEAAEMETPWVAFDGEHVHYPSVEESNTIMVNLGLPSGLKWAKCNVGATTETEYGKYFMWGDIEGEYVEGRTTTRNYTYANAPYYSGSNSSDYRTDAYPPATTLKKEDDAAYVASNGISRMPTAAEFQELYDNTTSTWETDFNGSGVNGRKFTSKTDPTKYIFIPASGYCHDTSLTSRGDLGHYWSSSLYSSNPNDAYNLRFHSNYVNPQHYYNRYYGFSVRGVSE